MKSRFNGPGSSTDIQGALYCLLLGKTLPHKKTCEYPIQGGQQHSHKYSHATDTRVISGGCGFSVGS